MMQKIENWPVDYNTLEKGDTISAERCEYLTGCKRTERAYPLALTILVSRIDSDLRQMGRVLTVKTEKDAIHICTDTEASVHNNRQFHIARRRLLRNHFRNMAVDVMQLADEMRKPHERNIEVNGRVVQAIHSAMELPPVVPVTRNVPGLPSPA